MADPKTWMDVAVAIGPTLVPSLAAVGTAVFITQRIETRKLKDQKVTEQAKIDSQAFLENQRLEFQKSIEHERMEFQRESETQKQRMELYKTIYTERIEVAKQLTKLVNMFTSKALEYRYRELGDEPCTITFKELDTLNNELYTYLHTNKWLVGEYVYAIGTDLARNGRGLYDAESSLYPEVEMVEVHSRRQRLSQAISEMMLGFDVKGIVFPK